mgnify:CR=1 FL=1
MIGLKVLKRRRAVPVELALQFIDVPVSNVSDCMSRLFAGGARLRPMHSGIPMSGPALTVRTRPGDNLMIHKALTMAQPGDVIVVDEKNDKRVPVGIITDRDIVIETLALDIDAKLFTAGDLMTTPVVTVLESSGFIETLRLMRNHKVRRMPVVTRNGAIFGIVAADDIVRLLAMELSIITDAMAEQTVKEGHLRK